MGATLLATLLLACQPAPPEDPAPSPPETPGDWPVYGADKANTHYAPLDHITPENVGGLRVVWRWRSPDEATLAEHPELRTWIHEATPLAIDGRLYTATSMSRVVALDAASGETLWVFDPETWRQGSPPNLGFVHRGVAYWRPPAASTRDSARIFIGTGDAYLYALDADSGEPMPGFGDGGRVDLTQGLSRPVDRDLYGVTSPPILCRDVVIVGSSISDDPLRADMPPGDVRGFDPMTGELRWRFATLAEPPLGDAEPSPLAGGNANVWTLMSCDETLGMVYLPVSTSTNDYYGGERPGDNLFAESLVALDAESGERVWHFQLVRHGLWDYDPPAAPNLVDFELDGSQVQAVAQVTKQAFTFVLDRATGEPIWPIEERPVPASRMAGEHAAPTQPFPTRPPAFDRQGITEDDLINFTPELRAEAVEILDRFDTGPLYTPPSDLPTLVLPGPVGGASWAGAAFDPRSGRLFVPSVTKPALVTLIEPGAEAPGHAYRGQVQVNPPGPRGLPLLAPPYGRVTAIDLTSGDLAWTRAIGDGPRDHPALAELDLPPLGWPRRSFVLLTDRLLFVAQQGDWRLGPMNAQGNAVLIENTSHDATLLALDPEDGSLLAEIPLLGNATGSPMSLLVSGRQMIVLPIGGGRLPAELIALAL
ncbi:MAG: pyrroloquinoline quinone-dependent dehydrogenase [Acidobacteriota bacterium]